MKYFFNLLNQKNNSNNQRNVSVLLKKRFRCEFFTRKNKKE